MHELLLPCDLTAHHHQKQPPSRLATREEAGQQTKHNRNIPAQHVGPCRTIPNDSISLRVRLPSPVTARSRSSPKLSRICRIGLQLGCLDNQIFPITHNAIEFAPQAIKRRTEEAGKVARRLTRLICRDRDFAHKLPVLNPLNISAIQSLRPR